MKQLMALALTLFAFNTASADSVRINTLESSLQYYRLSDCPSWTSIQNSFGAYGCSFYPSSAYVPEVNSLVQILNEQSRLIEALEARVKALEAK